MRKGLVVNESVEESSNDIEDDLTEAEEVRDDIETAAYLLERAKESFTQL
jgi:hypothetical protein